MDTTLTGKADGSDAVNYLMSVWMNELFRIAAEPTMTDKETKFVSDVALTVFGHAHSLAKTEAAEIALDEFKFSPRRLGLTVLHVAASSGNIRFINQVLGFVKGGLGAKSATGQTVEDTAKPGLVRDWVSATHHNSLMTQSAMTEMRQVSTVQEKYTVRDGWLASLRPVPAVPGAGS